MSSCKICPKGYYTNNQSKQDEEVVRNRCQECGRGTYGENIGQTTSKGCKYCDAGRYSDIEGLAKNNKIDLVCDVCQPGKTPNSKRTGAYFYYKCIYFRF